MLFVNGSSGITALEALRGARLRRPRWRTIRRSAGRKRPAASICDPDHSAKSVNGDNPPIIRPNMGVMSWRMFESAGLSSSIPASTKPRSTGAAASGTVHSDGAKNGSETTQSRKPWPVEFGWDFPFDFPKPASMTEDGRAAARPPFPPACVMTAGQEQPPGASPGPKSGDEAREINETGERRDPERGRPVGVVGQRQPAPRLRERETRRQQHPADQPPRKILRRRGGADHQREHQAARRRSARIRRPRPRQSPETPPRRSESARRAPRQDPLAARRR